jgi:outer membrane protein assembly factor BamB
MIQPHLLRSLTLPARLGIVLLLAAGAARAGDWPQFRGADLSGVAQETGLPERWGPDENVAWKAALPGRGVSAPVVVGDRVFVTANSGMAQTRLHVLCFDAGGGRKLWERQFWATGPTFCHPKTCMACPTPVGDGRCVYALFSTGDLVCLTAGGDVRWFRGLALDDPRMVNHVGAGSSPVLADGVLVVPLESQGSSHLLGLDPADGRTRWRAGRPLENSYTTPLVVRRRGQTEVLMQGMYGLTAYDPATGAPRWTFDAEELAQIPSPVPAGDLILAPGRGLLALRPTEGGPPEVVWKSPRLGSIAPTPLVADGRVYVLKGSILVCGSVANGKELWSERLKGSYSASPVLADGKLYLVNEDGVTTVVRPGAKPQVLAANDLRDPMLATPAVARGAIYLRSDKYLYCVRDPKRKS